MEFYNWVLMPCRALGAFGLYLTYAGAMPPDES